MWNDPISSEQFNEIAEMSNIRLENARGFVSNVKRGTAFYFNEYAADKFLETNGLSHIIRAHEMPFGGYRIDFNGKCITIFSCSHYCRASNIAACIFIDQEKLRIVKLDTTQNSPAMDNGKDF